MKLPETFLNQIKEILPHELAQFVGSLENPSPVSIRVNDKIPLQPSADKVAWCDSGFYLADRPLFTADPMFHAGAYYVQEASSMFLQQALEQYVSKHSMVLDLSAAPGGKSTLISQHLNEKGFLVSNEIVRNRANILAENMMKWGNANVLVSNNSPKDFQELPSFFDVLVVDAPCSGEGMFRKDEGAISEWSKQNVLMCSMRQKEILRDAWDTLKTEGILIYSTCTYNKSENEDIIEWIENELGAVFLPLRTEQFPEITVSDKGYRFYPHKTKGEGFFLSVLRKTSESPQPIKQKSLKKNQKKDKPVYSIKNQLINPGCWELTTDNNIISGVKNTHVESVDKLRKRLRTIHFGITLAEIKGKDFIPHISLALSKHINLENVNAVEIDENTAIHYLSKKTIQLPETKHGFILLKNKNLPIGWVKNLGNRCNNLYPKEWRIRMNIDENTDKPKLFHMTK